MSDELSLEDWLLSTAEKRAELLAYARSPISTDPGERQLDISKSLEMGQDAGDLLADADQYLSLALAKATLEARADHDAQTAKAVAQGATAGLQRVRDGIAVCYRSIKDRRFSLMSVGRW